MFTIDNINGPTLAGIEQRTADILNEEDVEIRSASEWDVLRTIAEENGDLQEIAALCIAQLMLENGE